MKVSNKENVHLRVKMSRVVPRSYLCDKIVIIGDIAIIIPVVEVTTSSAAVAVIADRTAYVCYRPLSGIAMGSMAVSISLV